MRVAFLSLDFGLLLLALFALLHNQGTNATQDDICPSSNCVSPEKCEWPTVQGVCGKSGDICCSILRAEYRTQCRHHGGECMDECNTNLIRRATDCPANQQCCVLV